MDHMQDQRENWLDKNVFIYKKRTRSFIYKKVNLQESI